jgi:hypothetical protein
MPESKETLTDHVENDQLRPENLQNGSDNESGELASLPDQEVNEDLQVETQQAALEGVAKQKDDKPDESAADRKKARKALKSISPPAGRRKRRHYSQEDIHLRFTSCGRCSLFLTTYRLSYEEEFLTAIEEIDADWLILPWHPDMRELVNKSYGSPVDVKSYYLEGTCPECRRSFSFAKPNPDQPAWFLIKL